MVCSVTPWTFLRSSASCLARGSPGEPSEERASPRTVLPFSSPPLAPAKHCPRALLRAWPSLVLPEGGSTASPLLWSLPLEQRSCLCPHLSRGSRRGGWRRGWEAKADFHVSQRAQAIRFVQLPKNKEALTVLAALTSLLSAPEDSV